MGDHYLMLLEQLESEANAYYLDQADHYDAEPDEDDWLTGQPWQDPGDIPF